MIVALHLAGVDRPGLRARRVARRLRSNVSTGLQPPPMKSEIMAVARGLRGGGFGAWGLTLIAATVQVSSAAEDVTPGAGR
jgi:hypothetical protein